MGIIVYYAPREEKTWIVHISCKLPPERKARMSNTRCSLANFPPLARAYTIFFSHRRLKCHIPVFAPGRNVVLSVRCEEKYYRMM